MATSKKVASTKTQKAAPAKKVAGKQTVPAKKAAVSPPAKKAAAPPKKAAVKTAAPKAAAKPVVAPPKVVASKTVTKAAPPSAAKKAPVAAHVEQPVKKATAPATAVSQKVPDTKVATPSVVAEKEKLISKPVENEEIMPVKKEDKEKVVAKDAGKKPAAQKTDKVAVKADKPAERTDKTDKKGSKATTLVTYQPEFTKSVLDQPEAPSGPVYRYSDVDLLEFKDLILKKLEAAKKELVYLQGLITRKDEAGTDDTENKYMSMEDGSGSQEREQLNQMASRQIQFIDHLEKAMIRIENKTYGICRVTGKLIDKARLRAVPHATLSIEAKLAKSK
ncbi:transcriptional regulator, TraR/DksA family [Chitinophaga sp. YR573]|uniref:TraR/DksA family transcriptional regulator n=1 Tax=Chitinophaga sp. YR573 TaxID=1881040 RepID=UPI0008CABA1F|nr:TraR/DksA C4-type zinc finger protein [Chitinophaga sp. YR573]SEW07921.1 transcriptional regulator, TraR/DksA family [Chitinophaga sp. YR573]